MARFPLRLARSAAAHIRDAIARRTAPPAVMAVCEEGLTRLPPGALAHLHERGVGAERAEVPGVLVVAGDPGGGVAVVGTDVPEAHADIEAVLAGAEVEVVRRAPFYVIRRRATEPSEP
ncbi:hypothetical protein [Rubrivirga sp.]|uniref:hypothetical protein n=1 Tax=Rubrivirga sp. TaxID=1885344 RepID=UPI003B51E738